MFFAARRPLSTQGWIVGGLLLALLGYGLVFLVTGRSWPEAAKASVRNLLALLVVALPYGWLIAAHVRRIGGWAELAVHLVLAVTFAYAWFLVLMIAIGFAAARSWSDFDVRPIFPDSASTWQLAQGAMTYAVLAFAIHARTERVKAAVPQPAPGPQRYFIRKDGDALPIDLRQVVLVRGADDYSEIVTTAGKHLVRLTLERFQKQTDPELFCRIHRSIIVNIAHIERFEPDGSGRMAVWMDNGECLRSSRDGSARLREKLI